ncbi:hypothetical protein [Nostoc sp. UHCC 0302]|uniref:hypothetical protein n=1 Tax=Nostoc sp. UHCC 0302 TaxID=3134896 RepID=UPI00311CB100
MNSLALEFSDKSTTEFFDVHSSPTVSRLGLRCPTRWEDFLGIFCLVAASSSIGLGFIFHLTYMGIKLSSAED